jgi:lipoyl(octanoyl) transferase
VPYHGPGQLIIYLLVDLRRGTLGVRSLVETMENAVIELLSRHGVESNSRRDAPGVYVREKKIAALGLRVRRGCTFHGLSLNVDMDLTPFNGINPCGYAGLAVTQLKDEGIDLTVEQAGEQLSTILIDAITPDNKADQ